jgi:predicted HTH domain antitoxin
MEYGLAVNITIDDELLHGVTLSPEQARLDLAVGLLTEEKVTRRRAAQIAGLDELEFIRELRRRQIPLQYDQDDFADDLQTIQQLDRK